MVEINTHHLFTLLYAFVSLFSVSVFGVAAEACDLVPSCPARVKAIIAFAVFVFLLSSVMLILQMLRLDMADSLHIFLAPLLFAINTVVAALSISPRTPISSTFAIELTWWTEVCCLLLVFLAVSDRSAAPTDKPGLEYPSPTSLNHSQTTSPIDTPADTTVPNV